MKPLAKILAIVLIVLCSSPKIWAQDCDIPIQIITTPQTEDIPDATINMINSRLANAVSSDGIIASDKYGQFFITARFNHISEDILPGPPRQFAVTTSLTLFIGDIAGQQVFASKSFDLQGVGTSSQRALINSLQGINARNDNFRDFISTGRDKIISYFNNNYNVILARAKKALSTRSYDEALYYATSIPECCIGYPEAVEAISSIFKSYLDYDSEMFYKKAFSVWASSPDVAGAREAALYLSLIDSSSSFYQKAQSLANEIKDTVRADYVFENKEKYKDSFALKSAYIDAARHIGVAYGNGQKQSTTNLLWIK